MSIDFYTYNLIFRRASFPSYSRFRVNKFELTLLCQLNGFLRFKNAVIVSKVELFDVVTNNGTEKAKMAGYYMGLLNKGMIGEYEYISQPGSTSVGLSDLGVNVLRQFEQELRKLSDRYKCSPLRVGVDTPAPTLQNAPRHTPKQSAA